MLRRLPLLALIAIAAALAGCGNKGPLYLPRADMPAAAATTAPAQASSVPAPASSSPSGQ